jgi:dUTP pyrophosphatase
MKFQVKKLRENAILPTRGSEKASGLDLYAIEDDVITVGETRLVRTGIAFCVPEGYEIQVRPRSGLSLKTPLMIKNSPGTVDQDYLGECSVVMHLLPNNAGIIEYTINRGDRIAQAVLCPVKILDPEVVDQFDVETERGAGGFGSTGK